MLEPDGGVVRELPFDQHMPVEAGETRNGKNTDAAEGGWIGIQYMAFGQIGFQLIFRCAAKSSDCDGAGFDPSLQRSARDFGFSAGFHQAVHDQLVFHAEILAKAAARGIAAVEPHEQVGPCGATEVFDGEILGHRIVDIKQGDRLCRGELKEIFGNGAINVCLACDRDSAGSQSAVDVAGNETERLFEGGPAFIGEHAVKAGTEVVFEERHEGQFILGQRCQFLGHSVPGAEFTRHIGGNGLDLFFPVCRGTEQLEEIQFGIFHHFDAEIVERLNRGVASVEILWSRSEGKHLEVSDADHHACNRNEVGYQACNRFGGSDGLFGNVGAQPAQTAVERGIQKAAKSIPASFDQGFAAFFGGGAEHKGKAEFLRADRNRAFGAEVPEIEYGGVDTLFFHFVGGRQGVRFRFNDPFAGDDGHFDFSAFRQHFLKPPAGQLERETVAANSDKADFD